MVHDSTRAAEDMEIQEYLQEKGRKHHVENNEKFSPEILTLVESKDEEKIIEKGIITVSY